MFNPFSYIYSFFTKTDESTEDSENENGVNAIETNENFNLDTRVKIITKDGVILELDYYTIRECQIVKDVLNLSDVLTDPIPLNSVESKHMEILIKFFNYFKKEPAYVPPVDSLECPGPTNKKAFNYIKKFNCQEVMQLIQAADFIDCPRAYDYLAWYVLDKVKGGTVRSMQNFFDVDEKGPKYTKEKQNRVDDRVVKNV